MGVSLHVIGLRDDLDPEHVKMVNARDALNAAGVQWPKQIYDYFDGSNDADAAITVDVPKSEWSNDHASGYEVNIADIPKNVKKIRVFLS